MQYVILVLQVLVALPRIGDMLERWLARWKAWRHGQDLAEVKAKINEAKTATKAATTAEERVDAAKKWQEALKKPRPADTAQ